jgi:hypothetical protein
MLLWLPRPESSEARKSQSRSVTCRLSEQVRAFAPDTAHDRPRKHPQEQRQPDLDTDGFVLDINARVDHVQHGSRVEGEPVAAPSIVERADEGC